MAEFDTGEFSVFQWLATGKGEDLQEQVRSFVSAEEAVKAAQHYTSCVAARMGLTSKVMITDGGDNCVFEWRKGEGVVFPPRNGEKANG